jgi:hypothetical protein
VEERVYVLDAKVLHAQLALVDLGLGPPDGSTEVAHHHWFGRFGYVRSGVLELFCH